MKNEGYWNATVEACYSTYRLASLCYILNSTDQISQDGCLEGKRSKDEAMYWTSGNEPHNELPIESTLRYIYDPYVRAYEEGLIELSQSTFQLSVIGIVMVILACILASVPGLFCYMKCKKKSGILFEMQLQDISRDRI